MKIAKETIEEVKKTEKLSLMVEFDDVVLPVDVDKETIDLFSNVCEPRFSLAADAIKLYLKGKQVAEIAYTQRSMYDPFGWSNWLGKK